MNDVSGWGLEEYYSISTLHEFSRPIVKSRKRNFYLKNDHVDKNVHQTPTRAKPPHSQSPNDILLYISPCFNIDLHGEASYNDETVTFWNNFFLLTVLTPRKAMSDRQQRIKRDVERINNTFINEDP